MEQIKINALLNYLGETLETVEIDVMPYGDDKIVVIDNAEYMVLTGDEAKEEFYDYQKMLIDDLGLDAFTDWAKDEILNSHTTQDYQQLFDEIQEESQQSYIEDLKYMNELDEEMENADCKDEDEFLEYLCEEDSVDWFKLNFGDEQYKRVVIEKDLIDWDSVINWIEDMEGRGCLAAYDNEELELENGLYAYRVN